MTRVVPTIKDQVLDAIAEFYQEYIKPETKQMIEDVLEEKLHEKLAPIRASQIEMERQLSQALEGYKVHEPKINNHEQRLTKLEQQTQNSV